MYLRRYIALSYLAKNISYGIAKTAFKKQKAGIG